MDSASSSICVIEEGEFDLSDIFKVVFSNESEEYSSVQDLKCDFTFNKGFVPSSGDYVALVNADYTSLKDDVARQNVAVTDAESSCLVFPAKDLPQDGDDFYQFIYMRDNVVCGKSSIFLLQAPRNVLADDKGDDDCIVINSPESHILSQTGLTDQFEHLQMNEENSVEEQSLPESLPDTKLDCIQMVEEYKKEIAFIEEEYKKQVSRLEECWMAIIKKEKEEILKESEEKLKAQDLKYTLLCTELQQKILDLSDSYKEKQRTLQVKNEELASELDKLKDNLIVVENERNEAMNEKMYLMSEVKSLKAKNEALGKASPEKGFLSNLLDQISGYEDLVEGLLISKAQLQKKLDNFERNGTNK